MLEDAASRPRLSWDEYKQRNQVGLQPSTVEEMLKYRKELDKQRAKVCCGAAIRVSARVRVRGPRAQRL